MIYIIESNKTRHRQKRYHNWFLIIQIMQLNDEENWYLNEHELIFLAPVSVSILTQMENCHAESSFPGKTCVIKSVFITF